MAFTMSYGATPTPPQKQAKTAAPKAAAARVRKPSTPRSRAEAMFGPAPVPPTEATISVAAGDAPTDAPENVQADGTAHDLPLIR